MEFIKWPSIEAFKNVKYELDKLDLAFTVRYGVKAKLHGTHAAIHYKEGKIVPQSRNKVLTLENDNYGFAAWCAKNHANLLKVFENSAEVVLFGEWCGKGIQTNVAISNIDKRFFAIYSIYFPETKRYDAVLEDFSNHIEGFDDLFCIYFEDYIDVNFKDELSVAALVNKVDKYVTKIDSECPFALYNLGVKGIGEGIVLHPLAIKKESWWDDKIEDWWYKLLMFKAKGTAYERKKAKPAKTPIDLELFASVEAMSNAYVTEARLQQALFETNSELGNMQQLKAFLKWISTDVLKESANEREVNKIDSKMLCKLVTKKAKAWFMPNAD